MLICPPITRWWNLSTACKADTHAGPNKPGPFNPLKGNTMKATFFAICSYAGGYLVGSAMVFVWSML